MNTVDVDRVNDRWDEVEKEKKALGMSPETIEFDKKNFYILTHSVFSRKTVLILRFRRWGVRQRENIKDCV
jgi:hypothetical protein